MISVKSLKLPAVKRLLHQPWIQALVAFILVTSLRLLWFTSKRQVLCHPQAKPYIQGDLPAIFCFWHGRMLVFPFFKPKNRAMHVLISQHRDGALIARSIAYFGIHSVRGSSSKGARQATAALLEMLQAGHNIAITPDGPRGPAFEAQRGALHLARLSGVVLLPVSFSSPNARVLRSWDHFIIPRLFAPIRIEIAAPIAIEPKATLQQLAQYKMRLEDALNAVSQLAPSPTDS